MMASSWWSNTYRITSLDKKYNPLFHTCLIELIYSFMNIHHHEIHTNNKYIYKLNIIYIQKQEIQFLYISPAGVLIAP